MLNNRGFTKLTIYSALTRQDFLGALQIQMNCKVRIEFRQFIEIVARSGLNCDVMARFSETTLLIPQIIKQSLPVFPQTINNQES